MNERIKELLAQAYDQAVPETWTTLSSEQLERVYEKFAELIVRESIQVVDDMADPEEDSDLFVWVLHNASEKIKQHFGVEE
jgi:cyclopropane fatty-acyl-phospholipid synthase-like methyltransferase